VTKETTESEVRTAVLWHGLREIGLAKLIGSLVFIIVTSSSTSVGIAMWVVQRADLSDVRANTAAIVAVRDSFVASTQRLQDVADRQDRTITGIIAEFDALEPNYCRVLQQQANLGVQMDRLMCRMDGATPNQCDLRHRPTTVECGT
jgi:biopolymer transport protein ExbB/TolQ